MQVDGGVEGGIGGGDCWVDAGAGAEEGCGFGEGGGGCCGGGGGEGVFRLEDEGGEGGDVGWDVVEGEVAEIHDFGAIFYCLLDYEVCFRILGVLGEVCASIAGNSKVRFTGWRSYGA